MSATRYVRRNVLDAIKERALAPWLRPCLAARDLAASPMSERVSSLIAPVVSVEENGSGPQRHRLHLIASRTVSDDIPSCGHHVPSRSPHSVGIM